MLNFVPEFIIPPNLESVLRISELRATSTTSLETKNF